MKIHKSLTVPGYTKYKIGKDDLVTVHGQQAQYSKEVADGVILCETAGSKHKFTRLFTWREISELILNGKMTVDKDHFSERSAIRRARDRRAHELEPDVILRAVMVTTFLSQESDEDNVDVRYRRSKDGIMAFYAVFKENQPELIEEARACIAKRGTGKLFVSPRQFQRLIEKFEEAEFEETSLISRQQGHSHSSSIFTESLEYQRTFFNKFRTADKNTIKACWEEMISQNKELKLGHALPSYTTFWRSVKEGNDFLNEVGRSENLQRIERKYNVKKKGLEVTRPLQIVEMDEHQMDVSIMLTKNGIMEHLHPDAQVRIKGLGRLWLSVALDAYSRVLVGAKFLKGSPDANSAVATLSMIARNKDMLAASVGAISGWSQCGTPENIHTDAGAGYVSSRFELACLMFCGRHRIPPSKHPHLRARVERFFRTINQRYIHLFSGQTFSNPLKRDEYDSEKYAHLTDDEFADLVLRLLIDCYHNTPHSSLGMTPLEAWERGSKTGSGAVAPPPTPERYREIFGATITRSIGNEGMKIAGNIYSSPELLEIRKKWFRHKLMVRMDDADISSICVKHRRRNQWIKVPAVFDGLKGVSIAVWEETVRYMKKRYGDQGVHSQDLVRKSIVDVKNTIARSKARTGIAIHESLTAKLEKIDSEISATFVYSQEQPYDYGAYDDHVDHENDPDVYDVYDEDEDEDEDPKSKKRGRKERMIEPLNVGSSPFKPEGVDFDRSGFMSAEERKRSVAGNGRDPSVAADRGTVKKTTTAKAAPTTTPENTQAGPTTVETAAEPKPRKPIRVERRSEEDSQ